MAKRVIIDLVANVHLTPGSVRSDRVIWSTRIGKGNLAYDAVGRGIDNQNVP